MTADPARQPNPTLARLGRALEGALNRALALDEDTRERLGALEGQRIGLQLRGMNLALAVTVKHKRLCVGPHWDAPGDLNLRAAPGSLLAMALRRGDESVLPPGKVEISGDAELARRDGETGARFPAGFRRSVCASVRRCDRCAVVAALQRAFAWGRESAGALAHNTAEYLREESRDLIAPAEMEQFLDDVDALRERADRLEARLQRLAPRARGEHRLDRAAAAAAHARHRHDRWCVTGLDELVDLAAHLFRPLKWLRPLLPRPRADIAELPRGARLRLALIELGPIFVKFGQILSTRRDLLPADVAEELALLQDQVPPFPGEQARAPSKPR